MSKYKKFLFICINILFLTIFIELGLRIINFPDNSYLRSNLNTDGEYIIQWDENFHHNYKPDQTFYRYPSQNEFFEPVQNKINKLGIRSNKIKYDKNASETVLIIGDSFIQADEIELSKTISSYINENSDFEAIQHGVFSWSPILEINWYNKIGFKLKPQKVILMLCLNDYYTTDKYYKLHDMHYRNGMSIVNGKDRYEINYNIPKFQFYKKIQILRLVNNILNHKNVSNLKQISQSDLNKLLLLEDTFFDEKFVSFFGDLNNVTIEVLSNMLKLYRPYEIWDDIHKHNYNNILNQIIKFKKELNEDNIELIVSYVPFAWEVNTFDNDIGRSLYGLSRATINNNGFESKLQTSIINNNITYLNIMETLKATKDRNLYLNHDGHWNNNGHEIVGKAIIKMLSKEKNSVEN